MKVAAVWLSNGGAVAYHGALSRTTMMPTVERPKGNARAQIRSVPLPTELIRDLLQTLPALCHLFSCNKYEYTHDDADEVLGRCGGVVLLVLIALFHRYKCGWSSFGHSTSALRWAGGSS